MFIAFEGIEGSGKSTVLEWLCDRFAGQGVSFLRTREPGGSDIGETLRALLLDARQTIVPEAELFLYLADRAQHVRQVIRPALERGEFVISDRYADSTIVYQGYGRGLDVEELFRLNEIAVGGLWPDMTVLLDVDPAVGLDRARVRNHEQGTDVTEGRFETEELSFHHRIRQGYLAWAKRHPRRFHIVDAALPMESVRAVIVNFMNTLLSHSNK
ncbi:MAG: dTMP kinase [Desulfovibrio sp.]|nr:dTMP kinase [Desulfovibrio sp.]